eukprot:236532-Rhodomonas_salina.3
MSWASNDRIPGGVTGKIMFWFSLVFIFAVVSYVFFRVYRRHRKESLQLAGLLQQLTVQKLIPCCHDERPPSGKWDGKMARSTSSDDVSVSMDVQFSPDGAVQGTGIRFGDGWMMKEGESQKDVEVFIFGKFNVTTGKVWWILSPHKAETDSLTLSTQDHLGLISDQYQSMLYPAYMHFARKIVCFLRAGWCPCVPIANDSEADKWESLCYFETSKIEPATWSALKGTFTEDSRGEGSIQLSPDPSTAV